MTTILRGLLGISTVALGLGLALHLAGWTHAERLIVAGLVVLVVIPIVNVAALVGDEVRRYLITRS